MSETDKNPLDLVREWVGALREPVAGTLKGFVAVRVTNDEKELFFERRWLDKWLSEKLSYFQHVGRTLLVRGIIDYVMDEWGTEEFWEEARERNLMMVDTGSVPRELRETVNERLPEIPKSRDAWLAAASSWREFRKDVLSNESLRRWEHAMELRYASGLYGKE